MIKGLVFGSMSINLCSSLFDIGLLIKVIDEMIDNTRKAQHQAACSENRMRIFIQLTFIPKLNEISGREYHDSPLNIHFLSRQHIN